MADKTLKNAVFRDLALLSSVGVQIVVVHGGGPEINQWLEKLGIKPVFLDGLRITDTETMDVVEMVLNGRVNKQIVSGINNCLLYTSPSPRDATLSRMPSSA